MDIQQFGVCFCHDTHTHTHTHTHTVADLCHYINSKLNRSEDKPLYIYAHNELVISKSSVIAEIYQEYREDDYFLYLGYWEDNTYADLHSN